MSKKKEVGIQIPVQELTISIVNAGTGHYTPWNRFKTWAWNFILPPHIRLGIEDKSKSTLK